MWECSLVVATCVLWVAGAPAPSAAPPQRHAVIVGINDYAGRAIPALKYAGADAMAVYAALADPRPACPAGWRRLLPPQPGEGASPFGQRRYLAFGGG
jgi:hypothetical protein